MIREIENHGVRLVIDAAPQVLRLECPEDMVWHEDDKVLSASIAALRLRGFVSASVLAAKAKAFDDGLIAAVELAAQAGAGTFAGKRVLLGQMAARLEPGVSADIVSAARRLGSGSGVLGWAGKLADYFLGDDTKSKPLGVYTWSRDLENVFRQDRMLQSELPDAEAIGSVSRALSGDPALRSGYLAWMSLAERLTNPFARHDLRPALSDLDRGAVPSFVEGTAISPPSESLEGALGKRLYGDTPIPEGFSLADCLIAAIRKRAGGLDPQVNSGWYDRIAWSIETLVAPDRGAEAAKLQLGARYRKTLEGLFKGILALARESHVKQLEIPDCGAAGGPDLPPLIVTPTLTVEPLPTHYLRRGLGYRFVREVLESTFGEAALSDLRRLTATGPVDIPLGDEIAAMESLFLGAHAVSCNEIGLDADTQATSGTATSFASWGADLVADSDLAADNRMMVPVFYDLMRKKVKVWALLGWTSRPLEVSFVTRPRVEVIRHETKAGWIGARKDDRPLEFLRDWYNLAYPVTAEIYVTRLLDRKEFRSHCNRYRTETQILGNLT